MGQDDKRQLGRILLERKLISVRDLDAALEGQRRTGGHLASRLTEEGTISEADALKGLSEQFGVPGMDLSQVTILLETLDFLPREVAESHRILPVLVSDDGVFVAMANPGDKKVIDELEFVTGRKAFPYVALSSGIDRALKAAYDAKANGATLYMGPNARDAGAGGNEGAPNGTRGAGGARPGTSAPPPPTARAEERPPVVMDDDMERATRAVALSDDEFGCVAEEISRVDFEPASAPGELVPEIPGQKTILLVDDEAEIRKMLKRLLMEKGYFVVEAARGFAALALLKRCSPDLILLDAMLPEVHGFDIARRIRKSEKYGNLPIVMISAVYRGWRYAEDLKANYGVNDYIEKPFRIADVLAAVERALAGTEVSADRGRAREEALSVRAERALADGILAYQNGDLSGAAEHLRRGATIDPLAFRLQFHLGLVLGKQDLIYEAIRALETALDINGGHFAALRSLAVLYQRAGFRNKAIEMWERALPSAPDEPTKQAIREHLLGLL